MRRTEKGILILYYGIFWEKIKKVLSINNSLRTSLQSLTVVVVFGLLAYHLLIVNGCTNPDGICEGLTTYTHAGWALVGSGRWGIRYLNNLTFNIVSPLIVILGYCVCIWLFIIVLHKLWRLSNLSVMVLSALLIVTPTIADQLTFTHTAWAYAVSCFVSVMGVYMIFNCHWTAGIVGGALNIALMLGLYQSYVGMFSVLALMTLILELFNHEKIRNLIKKIGLCIAASLFGGVLYIGILKIEMLHWGYDSVYRMVDISLLNILKALPQRIVYAYLKYIEFFKDTLMHRNLLYFIIFVILCLVLMALAHRLLRERYVVSVLCTIILMCLIPVATNIVGILVPNESIRNIMEYQTILIIPFTFACIEILKKEKVYLKTQFMCVVVSLILTWTYILADNATYKSYELSYRYINSQMQIALSRVYDLEEYVKDETPIIIAGFPNDTVLRENLSVYGYSENLYPNVVFWEDTNGALRNRYLYFLDYFGIDAKDIEMNEYEKVINTSDFENMPLWPEKDSVKMIKDAAVIKFSKNPPMP